MASPAPTSEVPVTDPTMASTAPRSQVPVTDRKDWDENKPATEFKLFSELPAELRIKVWNLNLPGPRNLNRLGQSPVAFSTCRESRIERELKGTFIRLKQADGKLAAWKDPTNDTIRWGPDSQKWGPEIFTIQNVLIPWMLPLSTLLGFFHIDFVLRFKDLQTLTLVALERNEDFPPTQLFCLKEVAVDSDQQKSKIEEALSYLTNVFKRLKAANPDWTEPKASVRCLSDGINVHSDAAALSERLEFGFWQ